jgi:hypothetical protein
MCGIDVLLLSAGAILFELAVRQSAVRVPLAGVAQRDAVRTLRH